MTDKLLIAPIGIF